MQKRILNPHSIYNLPVLHIFGVDRCTSSLRGCGKDQRVIEIKAMSLGNLNSRLVRIDGERNDPVAQGLDYLDRSINLGPIQLRLAPANLHELIHSLNTDDAALRHD